MALWLKQSTAVTIKFGPFLDETDGKTAETALTISQADIRLSKNGGNIAQSNNAAGATHDELGLYDIPLDTTDTNTLGTLRVAVHESGALPVWQDFMVVPANVWDSFFGADALQVHANEITAGLITAAAIADGAIDAGAIAADAITAAKIADGAIDANTFAAGAITASAIAADAIGASELAADAVAEIADAIWDEARAGHVTAGSFGEGVASVTGAVGSVTGNVGGNVTGSVGSVAAGGIVAASFAADAITAAKVAADVGTEFADALLNRDMSTGTDSGSATVRTVRQALRVLRNKASIAAGTLTVTKEDDTTTSWTGAVTTAAGDPISEIDPASA